MEGRKGMPCCVITPQLPDYDRHIDALIAELSFDTDYEIDCASDIVAYHTCLCKRPPPLAIVNEAQTA